ncbi:MAG: PEGA domain-containing protein [Planctomycetaceae bacterium]
MLNRRKWMFFLMLLGLTQVGCVHRRVTINSYPSGALVKVDGKDIGYTPASFDYTWYGTREVQLLRDGYETRTEMVDIPAPWYQKFPLDFVSDNFLGRHVTDHRQFSFQLEPKRSDLSNSVMQRAGSLRSEALHGQ